MIKTRLSEQEVAELDETKQKESRKGGFKLMSVRDMGYHKLSNGITIFWHHPKRESQPGKLPDGTEIITIASPKVPVGKFGLKIDSKVVVFDTEEFRKFLRWC